MLERISTVLLQMMLLRQLLLAICQFLGLWGWRLTRRHMGVTVAGHMIGKRRRVGQAAAQRAAMQNPWRLLQRGIQQDWKAHLREDLVQRMIIGIAMAFLSHQMMSKNSLGLCGKVPCTSPWTQIQVWMACLNSSTSTTSIHQARHAPVVHMMLIVAPPAASSKQDGLNLTMGCCTTHSLAVDCLPIWRNCVQYGLTWCVQCIALYCVASSAPFDVLRITLQNNRFHSQVIGPNHLLLLLMPCWKMLLPITNCVANEQQY